MPKANVLIATPSRGVMKAAFSVTLTQTIADLSRHGYAWGYAVKEGSDIVFQRNTLAASFLAADAYTHLFFVDDDMDVPGNVCRRMIESGKPVVGAICPARSADWTKLESGIREGLSFAQALGLAQHWHGQFKAKQIQAVNGLAQCEAFGMGVALLRRDALEEMVRRGVVKKHQTNEGPAYGFFDIAREGWNRWGEDLSFCKRWREECGGELWALIDADIGHVGTFRYGGAFRDALAAQPTQDKSQPA
jgi:hypothetical protein